MARKRLPYAFATFWRMVVCIPSICTQTGPKSPGRISQVTDNVLRGFEVFPQQEYRLRGSLSDQRRDNRAQEIREIEKM